jgi:hypothetical protein
MALTQRLEATGERMNARNDTTDIEDDGFTTIEFRDEAYWRQQEIYAYERMVNLLHDALLRDDYDYIDGMIIEAYEKLHGPRE